MKTSKIVVSVIAMAIIIVGIYFFTTGSSNPSNIRVGYLTSWAEGSFPIEAMREAGIAEKNGLNLSYEKFQVGPPLVEAALSNKLDVFLTGWVPAINLMTKSEDWVIVAKLTYFPIALMARNGSGIQSVEELKGKKIGVPYGSGAYPVVLSSLINHGLTPGKNVEIINIKPADMGSALQATQVDAVAWVEPSITVLQQKGLAYPIENYEDIGFIVFSKFYVKEHPEDVRKFLKAFKESQLYVAQNKKQAFKWFSDESQYDISLIESLKITDNNFNAKTLSDVDMTINQSWIEATQKKIDWEFEQKIIDKDVNLASKIDLSYLG